MAIVLCPDFTAPRQRPSDQRPPAAAGEIVIFTGVRVERHRPAGDPPPHDGTSGGLDRANG